MIALRIILNYPILRSLTWSCDGDASSFEDAAAVAEEGMKKNRLSGRRLCAACERSCTTGSLSSSSAVIAAAAASAAFFASRRSRRALSFCKGKIENRKTQGS